MKKLPLGFWVFIIAVLIGVAIDGWFTMKRSPAPLPSPYVSVEDPATWRGGATPVTIASTPLEWPSSPTQVTITAIPPEQTDPTIASTPPKWVDLTITLAEARHVQLDYELALATLEAIIEIAESTSQSPEKAATFRKAESGLKLRAAQWDAKMERINKAP